MELVIVAPFIGQLDAEMLKGQLAAEDIESFIAETNHNTARNGSAFKVAVWKKDEVKALEIVAKTYPDEIALLKVPDSEMIIATDSADSRLEIFLQSGKNQLIALLLVLGIAAIIYLALYYSGNL